MSLTSSDTAQANNYWCIVVAAIFNFITEEDWGELKYRKINTHTHTHNFAPETPALHQARKLYYL